MALIVLGDTINESTLVSFTTIKLISFTYLLSLLKRKEPQNNLTNEIEP